MRERKGRGMEKERKQNKGYTRYKTTCRQCTVSDRRLHGTAGSLGECLEIPESEKCEGKSPASPTDGQGLVAGSRVPKLSSCSASFGDRQSSTHHSVVTLGTPLHPRNLGSPVSQFLRSTSFLRLAVRM